MTDPEAPSGADPLPSPPAHPHRLVFLGTPEAAVASLEALLDAGFEVALVVTREDKRRGRRGEPTPSPVKLAALARGIPVSHRVADAAEAGADLGVVVAFGRILRRSLLEQLPMVNLHFSLLPRWRGAAPVERALLAGDEATGVCVMAVEEGLDTGGVYARRELAIRRTSTADELRAQLTAVGAELLVATLRAGLGTPEPQQGEATYAAKIGPDDLRLEWSRPAIELDRVVRVGGAWTTFRGKRLKVLAARPAAGAGRSDGVPGTLVDGGVSTGDGVLELLRVQPEGKGAQDAAAWRNGARPSPGERLGDGE
ncbi:MAG TPA: methionyl-tRNA formyltransferase [Aquihabitans sp.]|nr:methionyl-tRNA formyltransferase [Aquihabitans sp.]